MIYSGTVVDSSGSPVQSVAVELLSPDPASGEVANRTGVKATTDVFGRWTLPDYGQDWTGYSISYEKTGYWTGVYTIDLATTRPVIMERLQAAFPWWILLVGGLLVYWLGKKK